MAFSISAHRTSSSLRLSPCSLCGALGLGTTKISTPLASAFGAMMATTSDTSAGTEKTLLVNAASPFTILA